MTTAIILNTPAARLWLTEHTLYTRDYDASDEACLFHDRFADTLGNLPSPLSDWLWQTHANEHTIIVSTSAPHTHLNAFIRMLLQDTGQHEAFTHAKYTGWAALTKTSTTFLSPKEVNDQVAPWLASFDIAIGDFPCP